jgi:hypothetical protein
MRRLPSQCFSFLASDSSGSPALVNRGRNDGTVATLDVFLQTNAGAPSSASIVASVGCNAGTPRDESGRALTGRIELVPSPSFDFVDFWFASGVFASSRTFAEVRTFVEEFDASGRFVRGVDGTGFTLFREDAWWFSGSTSDSDAGDSWVIPVTDDRRIFATAGFSYRVWVDLRADVRGLGYGGVGGSAAIAQARVTLREIEFFFVPA